MFISALCAMNPDSTTIYTNAHIWTGEIDRPLQSVLIVNGNKIAAVGGEELLSHFKNEAEIIDLNGAFVVPGFIDNHTHLMAGGFQLTQVKLRHAQDRDQFVEILPETHPESILLLFLPWTPVWASGRELKKLQFQWRAI